MLPASVGSIFFFGFKFKCHPSFRTMVYVVVGSKISHGEGDFFTNNHVILLLYQ